MVLFKTEIMNIYTLCNVLSDNIITRNEFAIKFDKYFVWNNNNINELNEVYNINKKCSRHWSNAV